MDSAVAGAVGAVAGAVLGGGAKILQEHLRHRLESRTAARILSVELDDVGADASAVIELGTIRAVPGRWQRQIEMWHRHMEALARILSADDFETVAAGFVAIQVAQDMMPVAPTNDDGLTAYVNDDAKVALEHVWSHARASIAVLREARFTVAEKTRAMADLDRVPPLGQAIPDSSISLFPAQGPLQPDDG